MKKLASVFVMVVLTIGILWGEEDRGKEVERLQAASKVLNEIMAAPDKGIPEEILKAADCVAIVPSMLKGGFIFGARYGKGVASCRHGNSWSAPAPIRIEGGSWGLQIGGEAVDLVMLVMNQKGMQDLLQSKFKIGADVSGAAGPVGRHAEGTTDWKMRAEVLTYSRSRGAFAGITLNGAVVKQDEDDTVALYGKMVPFEAILSGKVPAPPDAQPFLATVAKHFKSAQEGEVAQAKPASPGAPATGGVTGTTTESGTSSTMGHDEQHARTGSIGSNMQTGKATPSTTTETGNVNTAGADEVTERIQNALRKEPGLSSSNVVVTVTNDTVKLSGSVPTQADKATVKRLAQENAGNRTVDDSNLIVK